MRTTKPIGRRELVRAVGLMAGGTLAGCILESNEPDEDTGDEPDAESQGVNDTTLNSLDPGHYDCLVIFRNDDPMPGQEIDALDDVEEIFLDENVPLTHGVIPAANNVPVDPDDPFCERLRERYTNHPEMVEFSVHGFNHHGETDFYGTSEFGDLDVEIQTERIQDGIDILEACVGQSMKSFIPPFNTYDETTVEILDTYGIPIISGGKWFTSEYFEHESIPFEAGGLLHIPNTHEFVSDWETGAFYSTESMIEAFDRVYELDYLYVQMLHYQYFTNDDRLAQLRTVIQHITDTEGVGCIKLGEFGLAYLSGEITREGGGWRYDPE